MDAPVAASSDSVTRPTSADYRILGTISEREAANRGELKDVEIARLRGDAVRREAEIARLNAENARRDTQLAQANTENVNLRNENAWLRAERALKDAAPKAELLPTQSLSAQCPPMSSSILTLSESKSGLRTLLLSPDRSMTHPAKVLSQFGALELNIQSERAGCKAAENALKVAMEARNGERKARKDEQEARVAEQQKHALELKERDVAHAVRQRAMRKAHASETRAGEDIALALINEKAIIREQLEITRDRLR